MSSYIDHRTLDGKILHSWKRDLAQRLRWLYGDHLARTRSPESVADITAWYKLGQRDAA